MAEKPEGIVSEELLERFMSAAYEGKSFEELGVSSPDVPSPKGPAASPVGGAAATISDQDWNSRFLHAIALLNKQTPNDESGSRFFWLWRQFDRLGKDFTYAAKTYGKIIISEVGLPHLEKTIKPLPLIGGVCGGDKYVVANMLFKFAVDSAGLFDGDDAAAAKVAGADLRGLEHVLECSVEGLNLPLMAIIDYRGFRLLAESIMPISKNTLVYGTHDAGRSMRNSCPQIAQYFQRVGERLNLKAHTISGVELFGPADMEGHLGEDGRFYSCDFSRLFPPEDPTRPDVPASWILPKNTHLYQQLRPEFVRRYANPLCSDAFSGFDKKESDAMQHKADIVAATKLLKEELVPKFANELPKYVRQQHEFCSRDLITALHDHGINIRHLGLVKHHTQAVGHAGCAMLCIVEMAARTIKVELNATIRRKVRELRTPLQEPYKEAVIEYLNLVFGATGSDYWRAQFKRQIRQKFGMQALSDAECAETHDLRAIISSVQYGDLNGLQLLFKRIASLCGLKFPPNIYLRFAKASCTRLFSLMDVCDLEELEERAKTLSKFAFAAGVGLERQADRYFSVDRTASQHFAEAALECYEAAKRSIDAPRTLCCEARLLAKWFSEWERAEKLLQQAVAIRNDAVTLFTMADFLETQNRLDEAEEYYCRSLKARPAYLACWKQYIEFVIWRKRSPARAEALAAELRPLGGPQPESVREFSRIYQKYGGGAPLPPKPQDAEGCLVS